MRILVAIWITALVVMAVGFAYMNNEINKVIEEKQGTYQYE